MLAAGLGVKKITRAAAQVRLDTQSLTWTEQTQSSGADFITRQCGERHVYWKITPKINL